MSDTVLIYIPEDPKHQPPGEAAARAASMLRSFVEVADEVTAVPTDDVRFYDPGENWSGVECSACGVDAEGWFGEAFDRAHAVQFQDLTVLTPCCGSRLSLNNLHYVWPAGFARFTLQAENPKVPTTAEQDQQLVDCLGTPLRKMWKRI